jgi:hypothetical protein
MSDHPSQNPDNAGEFARTAANDKAPGLLADVWDLLKHNKKWWLTPIVLALLLIGVLVALGSTAAAPFVYTLF